MKNAIIIYSGSTGSIEMEMGLNTTAALNTALIFYPSDMLPGSDCEDFVFCGFELSLTPEAGGHFSVTFLF